LINAQLGRKTDPESPVCATTLVADVGLSSLALAELFIDVEELVGYEIDPAALAQSNTVADIARIVNDLAPATAGRT
jgi:acyl carrier protein